MDARRLIKLGAPANKVRVTGNLKFDITPPDDIAEAGPRDTKKTGAKRDRFGSPAAPTTAKKKKF